MKTGMMRGAKVVVEIRKAGFRRFGGRRRKKMVLGKR
jgi:hypothetical protein